MNAYVKPLSKEEAAQLKAFSEDEVKYLDSVFSNPIFLKAVRRANMAKPSTDPDSGDHGDIRQLAKIKGWELYERALFASFAPKMEEYVEIIETYDEI